MKKLLVLFSSPRKKNTYMLVQKVEAQMKTLGDVEFEYVHLPDVEINPCRGCFVCFTKGPEKCRFAGKDDREMIVEKMHDADGVIFATPVHAMNMSTWLKIFLDRNAFMCHRPRFFDKPAMFVVSTGGTGIKETLNAMSIFQTWGFHTVVRLGVVTPPMKWKDVYKQKIDRDIQKAAEQFHRALMTKKEPSPNMNMVIFFQAFKTMFGLMPEELPKDHEYWKERGWLEKKRNYFTDVRVNPLRTAFAKFICALIKRGIPKNFEVSGLK